MVASLEFYDFYKEVKADPVSRLQWISEAAYYKAEARGFGPGNEVDDWLEAEREFADMKIAEFLAICREEGTMTLGDLRYLASVLGVEQPESKKLNFELVREIQNVCRHRPCFQTENRMLCEDQDCKWRPECRKLIAVWTR